MGGRGEVGRGDRVEFMGRDLLALRLRGNTEYRDFLDAGHLVEILLDLRRPHLEAGCIDHVLDPVDDGALLGIERAGGTGFAEQGGESLTQDSEGNVYLAAGQVFVYNSSGKLIDTILVPERPRDLVFGGKDGRTLFILTQSSLYAVRTRFAGIWISRTS